MIQALYNHVRHYLPRRKAMLNGYETRHARLFDLTVDDPNYKDDLLSAVRQAVSPGDDVVIIGLGYGISTLVAAEEVGGRGHVTVYEGGRRWIKDLPETLRLNTIDPQRIGVIHAIVSPDKTSLDGNVNGKTAGVAVASPKDLPECDVLELDCEGSELEILRNLGPRPETIIVETHPKHDAPTHAVTTALNAKGYSVEKVGEDTHSGDILRGTADA